MSSYVFYWCICSICFFSPYFTCTSVTPQCHPLRVTVTEGAVVEGDGYRGAVVEDDGYQGASVEYDSYRR